SAADLDARAGAGRAVTADYAVGHAGRAAVADVQAATGAAAGAVAADGAAGDGHRTVARRPHEDATAAVEGGVVADCAVGHRQPGGVEVEATAAVCRGDRVVADSAVGDRQRAGGEDAAGVGLGRVLRHADVG